MTDRAPGPPPLVLASGSPRRRALLDDAGLSFEVRPAAVDEHPRPGEQPLALARRLAVAKATAGARRAPQRAVLGADTVVALGSELLGKPTDTDDARRMLRLLSGAVVGVSSGVALVVEGEPTSAVVTTLLRFTELDDDTIAAYLDTGEPFGVAGAFRIQGEGGRLVAERTGCWTNVVGLPMCETARLLRRAGRRIDGDGC